MLGAMKIKFYNFFWNTLVPVIILIRFWNLKFFNFFGFKIFLQSLKQLIQIFTKQHLLSMFLLHSPTKMKPNTYTNEITQQIKLHFSLFLFFHNSYSMGIEEQEKKNNRERISLIKVRHYYGYLLMGWVNTKPTKEINSSPKLEKT